MTYGKNAIYMIFLILLAASLGYLSIDLYLPSLPAMTKVFLVTSEQSQMSVTVFLISFCTSQLFYGPLSDHYGRHPLLLIGVTIYTIATLVCISATTISMLFIGRFFQGMGIGAGAVLSRVMLRDRFSGTRLAQMASFLNVGVAVATTISPALGGLIQEQFGYRGNFIVLLLIGLVTLNLLFITSETNLSKTVTPVNYRQIMSSYVSVLLKSAFVCNAICGGIALAALVAYSIANPFLIQSRLGYSPAAYGIFALVIASCEIVGSLISSWLVTKFSIQQLLLSGFGIMLIMGIIMLILGRYSQMTVFNLLLPTMGVGISIGIIFPNASAAAFSILHTGIGAGGALYGFIQLLITAVVSSIVASLMIHSQFTIGLIIIVLSCLGLGLHSVQYLNFLTRPKKE